MKAYYRLQGSRADQMYLVEFNEDQIAISLNGPHHIGNWPTLEEDSKSAPGYNEGILIGPIDPETGNTYNYERWKKLIELGRLHNEKM